MEKFGEKSDYSDKQRQAIAIQQAKSVGEELAEDYPHIAGLSRNGEFVREIVAKIDWSAFGNLTEKVKEEAVKFALSGLIPKEERQKLAKQKRGRVGTTLRETRRGIFGLSEEEKKEIAKMGGGRSSKTKKGHTRIKS